MRLCFVLFLSVCLIAGGASAQNDWMPDTNLQEAVRDALDLSANASFTKSDLSTITKFKATKKGISDLTGLENMTAVEELEIWGNTFPNLNALSGLQSLTILKPGGNRKLTDISGLSTVLTLTHLGLKNARGLTDVSPLATLVNLQWLRLENVPASNLQTIAHLSEYALNDVDVDIPEPFSLSYYGGIYRNMGNASPPSPLDSGALIYENFGLEFGPALNLTDKSSSETAVNHYVVPVVDLSEYYTYFVLSDNTAGVSVANPVTWYRSHGPNEAPYARYYGIYFQATKNGSVTIKLKAGALKRKSDGLTSASGSITLTFKLVGKYDVDGDGDVDADDLLEVVKAFGDTGTDLEEDVNDDGVVNADDVRLVLNNFTNDAADAPQDVLVLLRELGLEFPESTKLLPKKTALLANYPNPFNPETWIPYHLAAPSDVKLTIYDLRGFVVRELELGHQLAGFYTSKSRAGYWDGKNAVGENVASGVYFYRLEADNTSALRKLVILK